VADERSIDELLDALTLDEQVALLAGTDFWHTAAIERLGIPAMRVTDGPTGARGTEFEGGPVSVNVPCSTSLAATWDPELVEEVGQLLGREVKVKGAVVLLAPTVNLHRTPVGGRNFECMSEDPYLTARTAVAYVRGVQAQGVASCIKHYIGNDTEFERNSIDSQIDERTLRELYMVPFEAAVREAGVKSVMTSYNRINGPFAADSRELLEGVLRGEWGFDGLVMSDWFGLHSTAEGVLAGLDLEMPGPTNHRGPKLVAAVEAGQVPRAAVRRAAGAVLQALRDLGVFQAGGPGPERGSDDPTAAPLVRRAGAAGMVLLRNADRGAGPVLPLRTQGLTSVAVIGPNAVRGQIMGGGSAQVRPTHVSHPLDALAQRLRPSGVRVTGAVGCVTYKRLPPLDLALCDRATVAFFGDPAAAGDPDAVPAVTTPARTTRFMWQDDPAGGSGPPSFGARFSATFTPDRGGAWSLGITSVSPAQLLVDGALLLDNADVKPGGSFFGMGKAEQVAEVALEAGRAYQLEVRLRRFASEQSMSGLHIGAAPPAERDLMDEALEAAGSADVAVVVVGTNADWESEGWDRDTLDLPGRQDELVRRVAEACPRTIVVVNAGSPVAMPWLDDVDAVVMAWFPGQEMGDALADVLLGAVEPEGRLPVTFPRRMEDTPAFEHHPGRNGVAPYLERRLIGYRWYDTVGREPLFPFGFGLGYSATSVTGASLLDEHHVEVRLANASTDRDGVEVVQVYAHQLDRTGLPPDEPDQRLVGFAKVPVPAGSSVTAHVALDPRAYQGWSEAAHAWVDGAGAYELRVGTSSRHVAERLRVRG